MTVTMFVFGVVAIEVWDTKFPVQYFILALVISFFYVIPSASSPLPFLKRFLLTARQSA